MKVLVTCLVAAAFAVVGPTSAVAQPDSDLNARVSVDFKAARAQDVLKTLASVASLQLVITDDEFSLVTITLNNVSVRTALEAVCETAGCKWTVSDGTPAVLKVTRAPGERKLEIKSNLSVHLKTALFEQAFRTLASYLQVDIVIEGKLPVKSVTLSVKEGTTTTLLDALCKAASCTWRIEPENKRLVISAK